MPLLYGEGEKSFLRLQHEILRHSADHSLFAWTVPKDLPKRWVGPLASSPEFFSRCGNIVRKNLVSEPYEMTNKGLRIDLPLSPERVGKLTSKMTEAERQIVVTDSQVALLDCTLEDLPSITLGIYVQYTLEGTYMRRNPHLLFRAEEFGEEYALTRLYISQPPQALTTERESSSTKHIIALRYDSVAAQGFALKNSSSIIGHAERLSGNPVQYPVLWTLGNGDVVGLGFWKQSCTKDSFSLLVGTYNDCLWADILGNLESGTEEQKTWLWRLEYEYLRFAPSLGSDVSDDHRLQLKGGQTIRVAIRRGIIQGEKGYNLVITVA